MSVLSATARTLLSVANWPSRPVRAKPSKGVSTVRVVKGRYKAYGQDLDITKGSVSFVGADQSKPQHPCRTPSFPVGCRCSEVLGSLNNPRVTLVAKEAMSEKDKLSWLILNRASSGGDSDNAHALRPPAHCLRVKSTTASALWMIWALPANAATSAQTGELNPAE